MQADEIVPILERLREQLVDFHQAVARAHNRAFLRTLEEATRQLRWLAVLSHEVAEDTWHGKLTSLLELASGLPAAALESGSLTPAALAHEARTYWQSSLPEAVSDLLSRHAGTAEDLQALARTLALLFEELARSVNGPSSAPGREAGEAGGERP